MRTAIMGLVIVASGAAPAFADETSLVLLGGLDLGVAHGSDTTGFVVGAEVSLPVVYFPSGNNFKKTEHPRFSLPSMPVWGGLYADLSRDFGADATRTTLGLEAGYGPFGIDGGVLINASDGNRTGYVIRPVLTASLVTLYGRYGHYTDEQPGNSFFEVGMLLKWGKPLLVR